MKFMFTSSLMLCFPVVLLRCFLDDCEMVPVVHTISDITFVFTLHLRCISVVFPYFQISSPNFSNAFLPPHSLLTDKFLSSSWIMTSGLSLGMDMSIFTC